MTTPLIPLLLVIMGILGVAAHAAGVIGSKRWFFIVSGISIVGMSAFIFATVLGEFGHYLPRASDGRFLREIVGWLFFCGSVVSTVLVWAIGFFFAACFHTLFRTGG